MDFRGKKYERGSNWSDPEVIELLQLWADESVQIELESCLRNQHVFNRIAEVLREKGILRTGDQCREKIKKMKLEYRRIKDNQKTVRGGRTWKFYEVMDQVLTNRPSTSYSSMGGTVVAHQILQGATSSDGYHLHNTTGPAVGTSASGALVFGHPPKPVDLLQIKREDVDSNDGLLNSDPPPPELLYQMSSVDEPDADSKSLGLDQEDSVEMGRGEAVANSGFSPSGFSDQNMASSSGTGGSTAAAPTGGSGEVGEGHEGNGQKTPGFIQQRKRRKAGRGGGGEGRGRAAVDEVLVRFLSWQHAAEERFLSLEEARLEREVEAEQRWERRAEQDRQHELRLFTVFASALAGMRPGTAPNPPAPPVHAQDPAQPQHMDTPTCGSERPQISTSLSSRGRRIRQHKGILQEGFNLYHADKHDINRNPNGIINLGTSENKLSYDLLSKRLTQMDMLHVDPALLEYPDWKGHAFLREEVASFLSHYCKSPNPLKAKNVVVMNGCGSLFSAIAAVICDPDDAILIPTPFYGVIKEDVEFYSGVKLVHAHLDCQPSEGDDQPFHLTVEKLEKSLQQAKAEGVRVRAVILVNPHNPLGDIYPAEEMTAFLEFAKQHELHAIVDEVYMLTVFDESAVFRSVLSFSRLPDPQRTHVLWGISKDFAAAGLRLGTVYSENQDFVAALDQLGNFHGISGTTQHQVACLLRDRDWISRKFLPQNRARLQAAHRYVTVELQSLGIPYLHRSAGFFVWADFRKVLREPSFQEEHALWRCFLKHKVLLSCGQAFSCTTPGWFRVVFTDHEQRLKLGMQRIQKALEELGQVLKRVDPEHINMVREDTDMMENGDSWADKTRDVKDPVKTKQPDENGGQDSPGLDSTSLSGEDFIMVDYQTSKPTTGWNLDSLIGALRQQIRSSDWLEKNTPELMAGEDPECFEVFKDLLQRARK
ncbi:1-aminocyclopropane-1-carboxylate synthase-like protein 1 [Megalops cyprinoides]|uniref:1-aminocyclopropane-1-carboxylate synthase-like protein 1 n=1 Tax=Megalops cyprinoides TaxID=118141 RepID=UPI00186433A5|nr:1-aminocyclopropane-1-carboxylate synthase-like protein 1 [Megalops cyprinoides]